MTSFRFRIMVDSGRKGYLRNEDGMRQATRGVIGNMKACLMRSLRGIGVDRDRDRDRDRYGPNIDLMVPEQTNFHKAARVGVLIRVADVNYVKSVPGVWLVDGAALCDVT
jgi:hypothetical protein